MKKITKEFIEITKKQPLHMISLLVFGVPAYLSLFIFCICVAMINLNVKIGLDTWESNK